MKKVSVLIPCYNEERSLPLLYDALKAISNDIPNYDWEFLFVNDGSIDGTQEVLVRLRETDARVNYVELIV